MPTRNRDLFYKVADAIEANPDRYDQTVWASDADWRSEDPHTCGTAFCIAGWTVALTSNRDELFSADEYSTVARHQLGLHQDEAYKLFDGDWLPRVEDQHDLYEPHLLAKHVATALRAIGDGADVFDVSLA